MKRFLTLLFSLLLICSLTGCWQEDLDKTDEEELWPMEPTENEEDPALHGLPSTFSLPYLSGQTLDPITCPNGVQQIIGSLIGEGLFHLNHAFQPEPVLCKSWSCNESFTAYYLTLRDVPFSDGSPLTAADVRASLLRAMTSPRYESRLSDVRSISAKNDVVTITLNQPNSRFPALLDIPILKSGSEKSIPIGTGPYLYDVTDGTPFLVASQNWWQGHHQPVSRITLSETSDSDAVLYRFNAHDIQLITADMTGSVPVHINGRFDSWVTDTTILQYLGCNTAAAPLDNPAFRQYLSMAINRPQLINAYLSGHGKAAQFPISPLTSLYPTELEFTASSTDFSDSFSKLDYTPERTLSILVNEGNQFKVSAAAYLASAFTAAGIPTEPRVLPWENFMEALETGDFDLYYGEVKLQADWDLSPLLSSGGALNYTAYADPELDLLLDGCRVTDDPTAVKSLCRALQETSPILPICFKSTSVYAQSGVMEGLSPTAAEPFFCLSDCAIHLRES